jgi:stage V sporulation protein B
MVLVTLLHWISVARLTGFRMQPFDFLKVTVAMIVMSATALWVWNINLLERSSLNLAAASFIATLVYLLLLILLKLVDRHDVARVPVIGRLFFPKPRP